MTWKQFEALKFVTHRPSNNGSGGYSAVLAAENILKNNFDYLVPML
jgi:hypothetical protein